MIEMIDGATEEHLLATSYDKDIQDVFSVQSEIAKQVSRTLGVKIRSIEKDRMEKKSTESVDAYGLCLESRFVLHKRTKEAMDEAANLLTRPSKVPQTRAGPQT